MTTNESLTTAGQSERPDLTVTLSSDPRGVHVAVHEGENCVYAGAHALPGPGQTVPMPASAPVSVPQDSPSDEEIISLAYDCNAMPESATDESIKRFACAVLSRYGRPAHPGDQAPAAAEDLS